MQNCDWTQGRDGADGAVQRFRYPGYMYIAMVLGDRWPCKSCRNACLTLLAELTNTPNQFKLWTNASHNEWRILKAGRLVTLFIGIGSNRASYYLYAHALINYWSPFFPWISVVEFSLLCNVVGQQRGPKSKHANVKKRAKWSVRAESSSPSMRACVSECVRESERVRESVCEWVPDWVNVSACVCEPITLCTPRAVCFLVT